MTFIGNDCKIAETTARADADKNNQVFIPPYNHPKIIGGQATIAVELEHQLDKIDAIFVPIGGGGLMSGISAYLKLIDKTIQCIGCQPEHSAVMYESVKAGRIIKMESKPTLADGVAGGIEQDAVTFEICRDNVDDYILSSEEEIAYSIRLILEHHYILIEGAAALPVASFLKAKERFRNKTIVLIISGKKITLDKLKKVIY